MTKLRPALPSLLLIIFACLIDQLIKFKVEEVLPYREKIDILPFLALFRTHNDGIAFSLLSEFHDLGLIVLTLLVTLFVGYLWWTTAAGRVFARMGFALIIGGAIGNLIDRSTLGYVVDYILFHTPGWSFAVFNLADVFISIGAMMVVLEEIIDWRRNRKSGEKP